MHGERVERANRFQSPQSDVRELLGLIGRLRLRVGLERLLMYALRGASATALLTVVVSIFEWLTDVRASVWLLSAPLVAAVVYGLIRWPSTRDAAERADRRLGLAERLATAVELAGRGSSGRFDGLQLRDAIETASAAPRGWLALDRGVRREALLALVCLMLALASRALPGLPRPQLWPSETPSAAMQALPIDQTAAVPPTDALQNPAQAADSQAVHTATDPDLASRVQQAQSERAALDRLSDALGRVSAGQGAADAIQRGDYAAARDQLANLGEEADQLSDAAKQRLSQALQTAANATAGDRQLADRERQAAQALSRNNYADQRQALRQLGDQLDRSAARGLPADELARQTGQLQQQQSGASGSPTGSPGRTSAGSTQASDPRSLGNQAGSNGNDAGASPGQGLSGGSGGGAQGDQGGPGAGSGSNPDVLGNGNSRIDTAGVRVDVPTKLGAGPGVRPPDGSEDQVGSNPNAGSRSVAEAAQPQQTGQVAPEQNLVPGEQRPVVRGYFR